MSGDLFRQEVLQRRGQPVHGSIVLAQPAGARWLTALAVAVGLSVAAYFTWGSYTRKVQVSGVLLPQSGLIKLASPQAGMVVALNITEGQVVRAGEVLAQVSAQRNASIGGVAGSVEAHVAQQLARKQDLLQAERSQQALLLREQSQALSQRVLNLQGEIGQIDREMATQQARLQLAGENLARYQSLVEQNFISPGQLQQHRADELEQQAKLQQLQRVRNSVARDLATAHNELRQMPLRTQPQQSALERDLAGLSQELSENAARQSVQIVAPHDGTITGLTVARGAVVPAGASLASLVPDRATLQAHLFAPSQAIGFIEPGQPVMLRYAAYPYQKFGHHSGRVMHVSKTSMSPADAMSMAGLGAQNPQATEPLYRITVQLDSPSIKAYGKSLPLGAGMTVDASVMQERRALWEWVLEPLYSISGKV